MSLSIHILFATMTGNAGYCAKAAEKAVRALGYETRLNNVSDVVPAELARDPILLFCASTYGEGDPPPDAESFYDSLKDLEGELFRNTRFAILALGDTNYDDFCGFGKKLGHELQRLGARPLLDRADADSDYDSMMETWVNDLCAILRPQGAAAAT